MVYCVDVDFLDNLGLEIEIFTGMILVDIFILISKFQRVENIFSSLDKSLSSLNYHVGGVEVNKTFLLRVFPCNFSRVGSISISIYVHTCCQLFIETCTV